MRTLIWAHRGASAYRVENTMSAFELAALQKADGVELDVQLSKDGIVVVHHDETVNRVWNGTGLIKDLEYDYLRALRPVRDTEDKRAYIPTLAEVLAFCHDKSMRVNIELKNSVQLYAGLEEKVIELVGQAEMQDGVIYSSFNHLSMLRMKELEKSARVGLLYSEIMAQPWVYAEGLHAYAIHPAQNSLYVPELIRRCHDKGIAVNVWTVDDQSVMRLCIDQGADGIITNVPDIAIRQLEQ